MFHYLALALFWFVYMGSVGIVLPYYSLYLKENAGLSGTELGWVLATLPLVGIVVQPLWGQVADRTGARSHIVALLAGGSALGYLALAAAGGFWWILLATAAVAVFGTAVLPITISVSLAMVRDAGPHAFGLVRVWGTVGYFVLIVSFPWILEKYQAAQGFVRGAAGASEPGLGIMFIVTAVLAAVAALVGFFLPRQGVVSMRAARGDWRLLLRNHAYVRFLIFSFAAYLLSQGPMWLFPIFVRSRGGDIETIRNMWIYMLVVEIPLVLASGSGLKRFGARGLLGVGVIVGGMRWLLSALIHDPQLLALVQTLHGVTVVGLLMGGPLYLDVVTPEKLRSTAQAFLSTVGVGIAGIVSNLGSGWLLDTAGINALYSGAGISSVLLGCLVWWILPAPERPKG
ncbi:MAG TPA: MFS transporter [Candidatus Binatia bacterium]|jgi:PPP family 3-phenylpropionic acid transporter